LWKKDKKYYYKTLNMKLGRLEKVNLRDYWKHEATDFTPWLAKEENITLLSEAVQMDLEVQSQEENVGPFRADILCKDTANDKFVLIENQLEVTDHKHLGQLLTYAAGLEAVSIIWIAESFTEEHRATLDWLNHITDETINFFGIEIELYKIGDSPAAPMFNIISKPNDWAKTVKRSAESSATAETNNFRLEYWTELKKYIESSGKNSFKLQKPLAQHWTNISIGKSGIHIAASVSKMHGWIRIELVFDSDQSKIQFNKLKTLYFEDSKTIFGKELIWSELPDVKVSSIYMKIDADTTNKSKWNEQHEWFRDNLEKFYNYFGPKIRSL
jgi:hypothetical protein